MTVAVSTTKIFSGKGTPGDLLDPQNWIGDVAPGIDNIAIIKMNVGGPVDETVSIGSMMLLGKETITFDGTLNTVSTIGCQGLMVCDEATAIFAPGAILNDANALVIGIDDVGTLLAEGHGTTHSVINSVIGLLGELDDAVGAVTIYDATWNNSSIAAIGLAGSGTLNVIDNGVVNFGGALEMSVDKGSSGKLTIASGGSVNVKLALWVGDRPTNPDASASVFVGAGSSLTVDRALYVGDGSKITIAGGTVTAGVVSQSITTVSGGIISGFGTLAVPDKMAIVDDGIIRAIDGNLTIDDSVGGTGSIQIAAHSTATITGSSLKLAGIAFIGPDATLSLAHGSDVTASISGFAIGDVITMANVNAVTFTASTGTLILSDNNATVESLHVVGNFVGDMFAVQQTTGDAIISLHHSI